MRVQVLARLAELGQPESSAQRELELRQRLGEEFVLEPLIRGIEVQASGDALQHLEQRVDPGLDGPLAQEPGGEAVDRLDPGPVEVARRVEEALPLGALRRGGPPLERRRARAWRAPPPPSR